MSTRMHNFGEYPALENRNENN